MQSKRIIACLLLALTYHQGFSIFPVTDYTLNITAEQDLNQAYVQTGKMITEVANTAQTSANTLNAVAMAKRNLMKFADWQNLSGFQGFAQKIEDVSDVGNSLGVATGGVAKGLSAMTGDKYSSMNALEDTLKSVGNTLDAQATYMNQQNRAYDQIANGLSSGDLDGAVSVMQGNADLLNAVAKQNQDISNKIGDLNKIELARTENEINEKKLQDQKDQEFMQSSLDGLLTYHDDSNFDFTKTQEYKY